MIVSLKVIVSRLALASPVDSGRVTHMRLSRVQHIPLPQASQQMLYHIETHLQLFLR